MAGSGFPLAKIHAVAVRAGVVHGQHLEREPTATPGLHAALGIACDSSRTVENLEWRAEPLEKRGGLDVEGGVVDMRVAAVGMNFRDILMVVGAYPGKLCQLGSDCSGVIVWSAEAAKRSDPGAGGVGEQRRA